MVTRRKDPNYAQVTSHIPKELVKQLKFYCTEHETTITEVVEIAVRDFLNKNQTPSPAKTKGEASGNGKERGKRSQPQTSKENP